MIPIKFKFDNDDYFTGEAFKKLRTNIMFCGTDVRVIAFTSCGMYEGKTTVCIELARAMAKVGKKVLLIDSDMRKSVMLTRYTDEKGIVGLSQYLSGMVEKDKVIYSADVSDEQSCDKFDIVFAGLFPPNPAELLGGSKFKEFIEEEKKNYDYIIIDTPPLGAVIDAAIVAAVCDSAVMVIGINTVKYRQAIDVKNQLEKSGCRVLGVVLNDVSGKKGLMYGSNFKHNKYSYYAKVYEDAGEKGQPDK